MGHGLLSKQHLPKIQRMEDRFFWHFLGNFALLTNEKKLVSMIRTGVFQSESMDFSTVIENDGTGQQGNRIALSVTA